MDNINFTYKYRFFNTELDEEICEIKYTDVPKDSPPSIKYQWIWIKNKIPTLLSFISMKDNFRCFKEGNLEMNEEGCKFNNNYFNKKN